MNAEGRTLVPGWAEARLADVARLNPKGWTLPPRDDEMVTFLPMAAVEAGSGRLDPSKVRPWAELKKGYTVFQEHDVLFAKVTPCMENGKCALAIGLKGGRGAGSTEFFVLRSSTALLPRYLLYFLLQKSFRRDARSAMQGVAGLLRVRPEFMENYRIPLPPLPEQQRIVAEIEKEFTRLDAGVEALKRIQAHLKRYRASVLKAACEGKVVPTEAELSRKEGREFESADKQLEGILSERRATWEANQLAKKSGSSSASRKYQEPVAANLSSVSRLPEGWVWTSVDAVGNVLLGRQRAPQYLTGKYLRPYLRVANVKDDALDVTDIEQMDFNAEHFSKYQLAVGDVLVSEGQSLELVGQSAIFRGGIEGLCFQKTLHRFRSIALGPSPEFAQIVFRSHVKSQTFRRFASITTNIAHLTLEKFRTVPFPLPPKKEQDRIVAKVGSLLSAADRVEKEVKDELVRSARLRQSILRLAFDGKLVAQNHTEEPAAILLERVRAEREKALSESRLPRSKAG